MLDVCSYAGAWAIAALTHGAREALCVDASEAALAVAARNAAANGVTLGTERGDAFEVLDELVRRGERFDAIVLDPPAFIKRKKDIPRGQAAYRKLNQLAMRLLERDALLVSCSCSYHLARRGAARADPGGGAPHQPLRAGALQRRPVARSSGASGDSRRRAISRPFSAASRANERARSGTLPPDRPTR